MQTTEARHGLPAGTVTFLFTDIEGSTRLLHQLGDGYAGVLSDQRRIVRETFRRHGGREVDTQGDSFFVAFADAASAVEAAAECQQALAAHPWPDGTELRIRMGLHTGEPLVVDDHYVGIDVHRGARIAAAAHGGQVLVSERTRELVADGAAGPTLRDLGAHRLKDLPAPERLYQLVVADLPSSFPPPRVHEDAPASAGLPDYSQPPADVPCPYKGLEPFQPDDSDLFFGREELVDDLAARVREAPFLAVVGPSGSGKSSLLRAGVLPRLGVAAEIITPGAHPLAELHAAGRPVALVVDQLEEVFTLCRDENERARFLDELLDLAAAGVPVMAALRADFYGHCASYPRLAAALEEHQALIGPMHEEELRRAIEGPAERAGLVLEPGLVEGILRDVVGEPGALPLLSHSLLETWRRRSGRMLTLIGYLQSGGVRGAVARTAESVYRDALTPEHQRLARNIFLRLTELGEGTEDTRRRVSLAEILPRDGAADVESVLSVLADARLITVGEGTVEVAHEALIRHWPTLRTWLDEDREGRLVHRHLTESAQEWEALGRDPGSLYRGTRLAGAADWAAAHDAELNDLEREFLAASRTAELGEIEATRRRNRRLRILVAALAVFLAGAVAAGILALVQRQNARDSATSAVAQRLGAQALVEKDLDLSLLLARQGVELEDSPVTRGNLLAALVRSPAAIGTVHPLRGRLLGIDSSADGKWLIAWSNNGETALVDAHTLRVARTFPETDVAYFSRDGRKVIGEQFDRGRIVVEDLATNRSRTLYPIPKDSVAGFTAPDLDFYAFVKADGSATVASVATRKHVLELHGAGGLGIWDVAFPAPRVLMTIEVKGDGEVAPEHVYRLRRLPSGRVFGEVRAPGSARAPWALSGDTRTLAVGIDDGTVRLYDVRTGKSRTLNGRHNAKPIGIGFGPGDRLVSTGDDNRAIVWDARSGALLETLSGHNGRVFGPAFSPDGTSVYTASLDGSVIEWDLSGRRRLGRPFRTGVPPFASPPDPNKTLALTRRGDRLAIVGGGGEVAIRDARTLALLRRIQAGEAGPVTNVAFSPDGRLLATSGAGGAARLWSASTGALVHELRGAPPKDGDFPNVVDAITFTPDGRTAVGGDGSSRVYFWSTRTGKPVGRPLPVDRPAPPPGPGAGDVMALAVSPDGSLLAVGHGTSATVYELPNRRRLYEVNVDDDFGRAAALAFSPDGSLLATGGGTGDVRFWDGRTGERRGRSIPASAGWVLSLAFAPDGQTVVSAGTDGTVRLLDVAGRSLTGSPLPGVENDHTIAIPTPDGKRVVVAAGAGNGFVWNVDPNAWKRQTCVVAGRTLTRDEWEQFLPDRAYDPACRA